MAFFLMFVFFMVWYFVICSENAIAPSDFSLIAVAIVCSIECIVAAFIKMRKGKGLSEKDEQSIEFVASVVAKVLDIAPPTLREAEQSNNVSYSYNEEDDDTEDNDTDDCEAVG